MIHRKKMIHVPGVGAPPNKPPGFAPNAFAGAGVVLPKPNPPCWAGAGAWPKSEPGAEAPNTLPPAGAPGAGATDPNAGAGAEPNSPPVGAGADRKFQTNDFEEWFSMRTHQMMITNQDLIHFITKKTH